MSATPVERLNAALEGRYRIESELGEGGMATVYLADDLKHERKVALKVLKPELAAVVGAERFLAEIKTTANLQHPHILPLFDSGEADTYLFYVMPYVEGETLRDRLDRDHQLPVDEAVQIAKNVAEALDYAHSQGVVHRDIKPANILLQAGKPVISDFGIALAVGVAGGGRLTETGLSLGTPHYMSPEQATGDLSVGAATDVYALGCVLYEMLVGDPPHIGSTAQAILGKIVTGDADPVTKHRKSVPANVDAAIRKSLEKVPADRFSGAQDFVKALADPGFRLGEGADGLEAPRRSSWQVAGLVGAAVGLLVGAVGAGVWSSGRAATVPDVMRFTIDPPAGATMDFTLVNRNLAISPDGRQIAYNGIGASAARPQINLRTIDQVAGAPLRGGDGGQGPFFSPDGEWVGFVFLDGTTLQKVSTFGGPPVTLTEAPAFIRGASWGADDQIIFGTANGGLYSVPGGGGESAVLTTPDVEQGEVSHRWPSLIPDRESVVFSIASSADALASGQLAVLDLSTREITRLGLPGTNPHYVSTGHLVYLAGDGSLRAVPFDVESLEVTGNPVPLVEGVAASGSGAANFDIADNGRLIYALGAAAGGGGAWEFVWVDRRGGEEPLPMPARPYFAPRVSPDGRQIVTSLESGSGFDLWVYDVATGAGIRLTEDDETNWIPIYQPDGQRIFFSSTRDAPRPESFTGVQWYGNVYAVPADGSGPAERLTTTEENQALSGISSDAQVLLYSKVIDNNTRWEIMTMLVDGSAEPLALVTGPSRRGSGMISPDGKWLAYRSDESGDWEIYVQPYPGPGAKVPVSIGGGVQPVWSQDGQELFYHGAGGMMMAATITGDATPLVSDRSELFSTTRYRTGIGPRLYHVAPDGRFLMMRTPGSSGSGDGGPSTNQITVVLNWFEELKERVPN
jgi:hypothetical protein